MQGKFIFKNGRIYEGMFEKDHIAEFPQFNIDGNTTPDISQIRTRTPLPSGTKKLFCNMMVKINVFNIIQYLRHFVSMMNIKHLSY